MTCFDTAWLQLYKTVLELTQSYKILKYLAILERLNELVLVL